MAKTIRRSKSLDIWLEKKSAILADASHDPLGALVESIGTAFNVAAGQQFLCSGKIRTDVDVIRLWESLSVAAEAYKIAEDLWTDERCKIFSRVTPGDGIQVGGASGASWTEAAFMYAGRCLGAVQIVCYPHQVALLQSDRTSIPPKELIDLRFEDICESISDLPEVDIEAVGVAIYKELQRARESGQTATTRLNDFETSVCEAISRLWERGLEWPTNADIEREIGGGRTEQYIKNHTGPMSRHGILATGPGGNGFKVITK